MAAAKLMNILWAKDRGGGVQKIMANNEKKDSPHGYLGFFLGGLMKHYPVMWGIPIRPL